MKTRLTKFIFVAALIAGVLGVGGVANATVTVNATSVTSDAALTITGAAASTWSLSAGALDIDSAGALSLNSSTGVINLGNDVVAQNINIGTGAAARTITIGNNTTTTAANVTTGTGGSTVTSSTITGDALAISATALTTGQAFQVTATNTHVADAVVKQVLLSLTNAQATLANTDFAGVSLDFTNNPTVAGNTEVAMRIQNQVTANATDNAVAALLLLDNADTTATGSTVVTDALRITNSGAIAAGVTNGINIASTTLTTGINFVNGFTGKAINIGTLSSTTPGSGVILSDSNPRVVDVHAEDNDVASTDTAITLSTGRFRLVRYASSVAEDYSLHGLVKYTTGVTKSRWGAGVIGAAEMVGTVTLSDLTTGVLGRFGTSATLTITGANDRVAAVTAFNNNTVALAGSGKTAGLLVMETDVGTPVDLDYGLEIKDSVATTGIKIGTSTTDIVLQNGATIVNGSADVLTITEVTTALVGGVTTADTFTSATGGENAMTITVTDSQAQTSGMSRGLVVVHNVSGAKSGSADSEGINVDMTLSGNTNDTFGTGVYVVDSGNKTHGGVFGSQVYMANMGTNTVSSIIGSYIGLESTNLAVGRHAALRLVNHVGTAKTAILLEGGWTTAIDLSGVGGEGTQAVVGTDIRLVNGETIDNATNGTITLGGKLLIAGAALGAHLTSSQTTPAVVTQANTTGITCSDGAGSASLCTDMRGQARFTPTGATDKNPVTVTFDKTYAVAPVCTISAGNTSSATDEVTGLIVTSTATTLVITPIANWAVADAHIYNYICIE